MEIWGLKETVDGLSTANGARWYGRVLKRDVDGALRVALDYEVSGKRKRRTTKKDLEKKSEINLNEDALN